tara:strand:- start:650 stop:871 length:222 start_codon:yes stop_codon:yes gene_type:complete
MTIETETASISLADTIEEMPIFLRETVEDMPAIVPEIRIPESVKPRKIDIGPDGSVSTSPLTVEDCDKRFYGR